MNRLPLSFTFRERVSLALVAALFLFLTAGLIKLQVVNHSELAARSENNRIRVVPTVPRRGRVYDREGRILIDNRPSYTLSVVPAEEVAGITLSNLAELINLDTTEIRRRIRKNMVNRYQPSPIRQDIPFEVVAVLEEQNKRFPGVTYQAERVRQYLPDLSDESFTGYVGEVSREELGGKAQSDLRLGSMVGKKGLEREYDEAVRGREGTKYIEVYASGQIGGVYADKKPIEPVAGADLTLTIDIDLQRTCAELLDTFCCGAIVAMDPRSGGVLAMVSYPGYDANIFSSVIPESLWTAISTDSSHPLLNRPLTGLYPPGSTVKFVTTGAGLEEKIVTPGTVFSPCTGGYQFGNRVFHCWDLGGHGSLNATHSLEQSCDIYFYQLGRKLGVDVLASYYDRCGFGHRTGIDLPSEAAGLNPDSKYYNERYGKAKWTQGLVLNLAIGQGELLVTPLQLTQFFCGLANDGVVYKPHFVQKRTRSNGQEVFNAPEVSLRLPFSSGTMAVLREGLRLVVEGSKGTAKHLRSQMYSLGGKTGTAQNPHGENHSWFVGVAPLERPEIVVCAIVENAGHGSEIAAPVVAAVIRAYMDKKLGWEVLSQAAGETP